MFEEGSYWNCKLQNVIVWSFSALRNERFSISTTQKSIVQAIHVRGYFQGIYKKL